MEYTCRTITNYCQKIIDVELKNYLQRLLFVHRRRNTAMKLLSINYTLLKNYGLIIIAGELLLVLKVHVCTDCATSRKYW
jgi:hypothetical protein